MRTSDLIESCKRGDKAALGELYGLYSKRMMKIVCHYITDWSIAQDILHDGFLIVFSRINQLRDASKLEYWMGSIMKNLSLQYLKETDFFQLLTDDFDTPEIPDFEESISMEELETMINRLPIGYRKVFKLAVLEHKTHKEIGKLLGISEQTSGSQLFHARVMLRKMITEYRIETGLIAIILVWTLGLLIRNDENTDQSRQTEDSILLSKISQPTIKINKNDDKQTEITNNNLNFHRTNKPNIIIVKTEGESDAISYDHNKKDEIVISEIADTADSSSKMIAHDKEDSIPCNIRMKINTNCQQMVYSLPSSCNKGIEISVMGNILGHGSINNSVIPSLDNPNLTNPGEIVEETVVYDYPLTFSVNISKILSDRWNLESGIQFSLLKSQKSMTTKNGNNMISATSQEISAYYIGIPLRFRYRFHSVGKISLYSGIGGNVYFPVKGKLHTVGMNGENDKGQFNPSVQWAINGCLGIEYHFTPNLGLFAEPSINYHFRSTMPYPIIWQDKPFNLSIPVGLRLTW